MKAPIIRLGISVASFFLLAGTGAAQNRLVPKAPKGEPALPVFSKIYSRADYHPFKFEVARKADHTKAMMTLINVKGNQFTFRTEQGNRVSFDYNELRVSTQQWIERYRIRGAAGPMPLPPEQEAAINKEGFRSYVFERPAVPSDIANYVPEWERTNQRLPFLLFAPAEAKNSSQTFPVIIFLHGIGGRGDDNWKPFSVDGGGAQNHFLNLAKHDWQKATPCYIIVPQSNTANNWWYESNPLLTAPAVRLTGQLLDVLKAKYIKSLDLSRVYVTGFSGGGFGCYEFIRQFPGKFAAIVPIAAMNDEISITNRYMACPEWSFVNEGDKTINWKYVRWAGTAWSTWNVERRITIYEGAMGHNTWARAYGDTDFRKWLQRQQLRTVSWPVDTSVSAD